MTPWWEVSGRPVTFWSTYRFEQGDQANDTQVRLFVTPLGQWGQGFRSGCLGSAETNLREGGSTGLSRPVVFHRLFWTPAWDGDEDLTPMEQLALTAYDTPDQRYNRFWHHAALSWDTTQMNFPLAPVLAAETPLLLVAEPRDRFSVTLSLGSRAPAVPNGCRLRAVLMGVAVEPSHVEETLADFGALYRKGQHPIPTHPLAVTT